MSLKVRSGVVSSIEKDKDLKKVLKEGKKEGYDTPRADAAINKVLAQLKAMNEQIDSINAGLREQKSTLESLVASDKKVHEKVDKVDLPSEPVSDGAKFEQEEKIKEGGTEE